MAWQDWVFTIGGVALLLSLIPTLRGVQKPAVATSAGNMVIVLVFAVALGSFGLWFSVVTNVCIAAAWATLALQRLRQGSTLPAQTYATPVREGERV